MELHWKPFNLQTYIFTQGCNSKNCWSIFGVVIIWNVFTLEFQCQFQNYASVILYYPSIHSLSLCRVVGFEVNPSIHWARGTVQPVQVAVSQSIIGLIHTGKLTLSHTYGNSEFLIPLTCLSVDYGRKPSGGNLCKHGEKMQNPYRKAPVGFKQRTYLLISIDSTKSCKSGQIWSKTKENRLRIDCNLKKNFGHISVCTAKEQISSNASKLRNTLI